MSSVSSSIHIARTAIVNFAQSAQNSVAKAFRHVAGQNSSHPVLNDASKPSGLRRFLNRMSMGHSDERRARDSGRTERGARGTEGRSATQQRNAPKIYQPSVGSAQELFIPLHSGPQGQNRPLEGQQQHLVMPDFHLLNISNSNAWAEPSSDGHEERENEAVTTANSTARETMRAIVGDTYRALFEGGNQSIPPELAAIRSAVAQRARPDNALTKDEKKKVDSYMENKYRSELKRVFTQARDAMKAAGLPTDNLMEKLEYRKKSLAANLRGAWARQEKRHVDALVPRIIDRTNEQSASLVYLIVEAAHQGLAEGKSRLLTPGLQDVIDKLQHSWRTDKNLSADEMKVVESYIANACKANIDTLFAHARTEIKDRGWPTEQLSSAWNKRKENLQADVATLCSKFEWAIPLPAFEESLEILRREPDLSNYAGLLRYCAYHQRPDLIANYQGEFIAPINFDQASGRYLANPAHAQIIEDLKGHTEKLIEDTNWCFEIEPILDEKSAARAGGTSDPGIPLTHAETLTIIAKHPGAPLTKAAVNMHSLENLLRDVATICHVDRSGNQYRVQDGTLAQFIRSQMSELKESMELGTIYQLENLVSHLEDIAEQLDELAVRLDTIKKVDQLRQFVQQK